MIFKLAGPRLAICWLLTGGVALRADTNASSASGVALISRELSALKLGGKAADDCRVKIVSVQGQAFKEALQVETLKQPPYPWNMTLATPTTRAMRQGDVLLATVTAQRVKSRQETGEARIQIIVEESSPEHHKLLELAASVGPDWTQLRAPFVTDKASPAGAAQLSLRFGFQPQIIEVAAVGLTNYGTKVALRNLPRTVARYAGWEADAPWRKMAAERIEKIRKGGLRVEVVDAQGKAVAGAEISVRLLRHEFAFGSALQARRLAAPVGPDDERYRRTIEKYFNKVVFENDLKWPRWLTNRADWMQHRQEVFAAINWLQARNIAIRGHVMIWPSWENTPGFLREFASQPGRLRQAIDDHIADQTATLNGKVAEWDVINESYAHNDIIKLLGWEEMAHWFQLAHQGDPSVKLFYNDYIMFAGDGEDSPSQYFFDTVKFLQQQGAPVGGIGEQGYFGGSPPAPEQVLATFDRFAKLGVPIQISEFDIDTSDDELKAHYTRDFLTACFSHPAVSGVMMWGFWEGAHWRPRAALWNQDWTIRPHGQAWLDLVTRDWGGADLHGVTAADGGFTARGFKGEYEVIIRYGTQTRTLNTTLQDALRKLLVRLE